jgi:hypothetical protein
VELFSGRFFGVVGPVEGVAEVRMVVFGQAEAGVRYQSIS